MSRNKNKPNSAPRPIITTPFQSFVAQGKTAFKRGDYKLAILHWEKAWASSGQPADQMALVSAALAEAHFREGQFRLFSAPDEALQHLKDAAELCQADPLYAHHVGLALHRRGDLNGALGWYRKALARDPAFRRTAYEICLIVRQQKNFLKPFERDPAWKVLDAIQQARLQAKPTSDPIDVGLTAYAAGDWDGAQVALEKISATPEQFPARIRGLALAYLGALAQRRGDPAAAITLWTAALDQGAQTATATNNLGLAYVLRAEAALTAGNPDLALREVETGLRILPDHKRLIELQGFLRLKSGYELAEQGKWKAALDIWKPVDALGGANGRYLAANRALAYEKSDLTKDAADAWREFARRRPRKGGSDDSLSEAQVARLWSRVSTLYMKAGLPDDAIDSLQTALKYQPDDLQLGLALTHRLLEAERDEAAAKQMERLYKDHPKDIEVLVLRAEMAEMGIQRRDMWGNRLATGIDQWEDVYATKDETYAPVARERLEALYLNAIDEFEFFGQKAAMQSVYERAFKTLPDYYFIRALYVTDLLQVPKRRKEALEQIALIDLMDDDALRQLIDGWYLAKEPAQAKALLEKGEALKPRQAALYTSLAEDALERGQPDVSKIYEQEALARATDADERLKVRITIAMSRVKEDPAGTIATLKDILKENRTFAPLLLALVVAHMTSGDLPSAKKYLRDAERAARTINDPHMMDTIEHIQQVLDSPFAGFPGMMGGMGGKPGGLPPLPPGIFDAEFDDDDFDDNDFDDMLPPMGIFGNIQDIINNPANNPPVSDRRRRRMEKQDPSASPDKNAKNDQGA